MPDEFFFMPYFLQKNTKIPYFFEKLQKYPTFRYHAICSCEVPKNFRYHATSSSEVP